MNTTRDHTIIAVALAMMLIALSNTAGADTHSDEITSARQESQISTTYSLSNYLRSDDIKVSVKNGKATLTGVVREEINKDLAKQIALGVKGIEKVDNNISVEPDYTAKKSSANDRNYGEIIDDITITTIVKSKLLWSKYADGLATNVDTNLGKVTLNGSADTEKNKELAGSLAKNTEGVVSVDNRLKVKAAKAVATEKTDVAIKTEDSTVAKAVDAGKVSNDKVATKTVPVKTIAVNTVAEKTVAEKTVAEKTVVAEKMIKDTEPMDKPITKTLTESTSGTATDSGITADLKSKFSSSSSVNSQDISVSTDKGVVTLTGKVRSSAERELAIEFAENIRGVKSVDATKLVI